MNILKWSLLVSMQLTLLSGSILGGVGYGAANNASKLDLKTAAATTVASVSGEPSNYTFALPKGANNSFDKQTLHLIDLKKWGIRNDGTKPVETTQGINKALQWLNKNGITAATLPAGTYLIDKNSRINMVSNMLFELSADTILQKESNAKEKYFLMYIGVNVTNVTLRGGVYNGDKGTHNYAARDSKHSSGTHESGYGIATEGANAITIEDVTSTNFTGDGLVIGAHGTMAMDVYDNSFESGEFNDKGAKVANKDRIRTKKALRFDHKIFMGSREFELANPINLPRSFDLYIYDKQNKLISKLIGKKARETIQIPDKADYFHVVFHKSTFKGSYFEFWNRIESSNIVVRKSEFAYNRRQGITVGGADLVLIENNELHHIKGTLPQAGIDVEGGYGENGNLNSRIVIKGNKFHNNATYDIVLYDGKDAIVEDNHLGSWGAIGLVISPPFTGAMVRNNHFDGSRILAYHDATFLNNRMNNSYTLFEGPNVKIDGLTMTDSIFTINSKQPFGVTASNISITSTTKKLEAGLSLWGKPIELNNITISGESALRTVTGGIEPGSTINNLKVTNYNSNSGLSLPPATYNNCAFSGAEGGKHGALTIGSSSGGPYVFNNCTFKSSSTAANSIFAQHPKLDLTIKNSSFELLGNTRAITIGAAANVLFEKNSIVATGLTSDKLELIMFNDYWKREEQHDILKAIIRGNTITANLKTIGISTVNAGKGAPSYVIEDNTLVNTKLALKSNDTSTNNVEK